MFGIVFRFFPRSLLSGIYWYEGILAEIPPGFRIQSNHKVFDSEGDKIVSVECAAIGFSVTQFASISVLAETARWLDSCCKF